MEINRLIIALSISAAVITGTLSAWYYDANKQPEHYVRDVRDIENDVNSKKEADTKCEELKKRTDIEEKKNKYLKEGQETNEDTEEIKELRKKLRTSADALKTASDTCLGEIEDIEKNVKDNGMRKTRLDVLEISECFKTLDETLKSCEDDSDKLAKAIKAYEEEKKRKAEAAARAAAEAERRRQREAERASSVSEDTYNNQSSSSYSDSDYSDSYSSSYSSGYSGGSRYSGGGNRSYSGGGSNPVGGGGGTSSGGTGDTTGGSGNVNSAPIGESESGGDWYNGGSYTEQRGRNE